MIQSYNQRRIQSDFWSDFNLDRTAFSNLKNVFMKFELQVCLCNIGIGDDVNNTSIMGRITCHQVVWPSNIWNVKVPHYVYLYYLLFDRFNYSKSKNPHIHILQVLFWKRKIDTIVRIYKEKKNRVHNFDIIALIDKITRCRVLFVIYVWSAGFIVYILQNLSTTLILQPLQLAYVFTNE